MNRNYLKNNICEFTPLFKINFFKKKNIIITSLFKMTKGYKDFYKYLKGIKLISNKIIKWNLPFEFRIFIDETIYKDKKIMNFLNNINNAKLILYHCPSFFIDNHHRGTFGTILRFFPMFNFENNDSDIVICMDSDTSDMYFRELIKGFYLMKKNNLLENLSLFYSSSIAKNQSQKFNDIIYPYIMAGLIINRLKFDTYLIQEYLDDVLISKTNFKNYYNHDVVQITKKIDTKIFYGFDEIFLNHKLLPYLVENKKKICIYDEYSFIYQFFYIIRSPNFNKEPKIYKSFFEYILKDYQFKHTDLESSFKYIDDILYKKILQNIKLSEKEVRLCIRIYKFYKYIYDKDTVKYFNKNFLYYILQKKNIGVIYSIKLKNINYNNKKDITIRKKVY